MYFAIDSLVISVTKNEILCLKRICQVALESKDLKKNNGFVYSIKDDEIEVCKKLLKLIKEDVDKKDVDKLDFTGLNIKGDDFYFLNFAMRAVMSIEENELEKRLQKEDFPILARYQDIFYKIDNVFRRISPLHFLL
jgi:thiol-disulfide isomerase/thioredoxin